MVATSQVAPPCTSAWVMAWVTSSGVICLLPLHAPPARRHGSASVRSDAGLRTALARRRGSARLLRLAPGAQAVDDRDNRQRADQANGEVAESDRGDGITARHQPVAEIEEWTRDDVVRLDAQQIWHEVAGGADAQQIGHELVGARAMVGVAHQLDQEHGEEGN